MPAGAASAMDSQALSELSVVIPNLHWRYSGVTATNRMVAPRLAGYGSAAWLGSDAPAGMPRLTLRNLLALRTARGRAKPRIWHARRNDEMLVGVLLRALGWPFRLIFTSAGQRRHSWLTRFLIARMDAVIATSARSASYLRRSATVVHHGVDTQVYCPPPDRLAAYAATGLPGRYGIGCFGRVRVQKGTDVFVEAMCALLPKYPDFTALVIGPVTADQRGFAETLEARVRAAGLAGRVRFLGALPIAQVPPWYQRISIYAFTSRNEGFGLTLIEAMAAGAALVAARAGAAETVVEDGVSGVLVPPGDVEALVAALEPLLREPARAAELGRNARARVLAEFTIDAEVARIAAVYRQVLRA
ncbi:MAG: mannosyltransferase [Alphaproteobacteria bacterium]|jgi:mannosyltransferase|nr:mannosyltransferase [Alphaproteobacteria bacterium]